jgi:hypothetical protein
VNNGAFLSIEEESAAFGISGRGHGMFEDVGDDEDGTIVGSGRGLGAEEEMATISAPGFGFGEVVTSGVGVHLYGIVLSSWTSAATVAIVPWVCAEERVSRAASMVASTAWT